MARTIIKSPCSKRLYQGHIYRINERSMFHQGAVFRGFGVCFYETAARYE